MKYLFTFLMVFLFVPELQAVCPALTTDTSREAKEAVRKVKEYAIEYYEDLINKSEKEIKESKQGNAACKSSPENTKENIIKTETFKYLSEEVLDEEDEADDFLPRTRDFNEAKLAVKEKFYHESDTQLTERGQALKDATGFDASTGGLKTTAELFEVLRDREQYANAVMSKNLSISMDLREKINTDLKSTEKVATSGCNQLQGMLLENRNLAALLKETAADIVVQILTLESLAARNLQKDSPQLLAVPQKGDQKKQSKIAKTVNSVKETAGDVSGIVSDLSSVAGSPMSQF